MLLLFVVSQIVGLGLFSLTGLEIKDMASPSADHPNASKLRLVLLAYQGISSMLMFWGSSWLTLNWSVAAHVADLNEARLFNIKQAAWVFLLCMISIPAIGTMTELNKDLDFSFLGSAVNNYIISTEKQLEVLTTFLVQANSFSETILLVLVVAVVAALSEELLFRGVIQNLLLQTTRNPHLAIWLSAIIFGAIHMQFQTMLPRVMLGALFGYIYFWSGNLYLAMAGHFINNFVTAVAMLMAFRSGLEPDALDHVPVWAGISSLLAVVFGALLYRKQSFEALELNPELAEQY